MQGIGPLQTPRDLLAKLAHDLERMRADPTDIYAAFDFFFTAHHMLDWVAPTPDARKDPVGYQAAIAKHQAIEGKEPRLLIAGHLANNAKHFEAHRWDEVSATFAVGGHYHPDYWPKEYFPKGYFPEARLVIRLTAAGAAFFNGEKELNALDTAEKLYAFWAGEIS
jgi:hypothetical protein